jgi:hypothetical protein
MVSQLQCPEHATHGKDLSEYLKKLPTGKGSPASKAHHCILVSHSSATHSALLSSHRAVVHQVSRLKCKHDHFNWLLVRACVVPCTHVLSSLKI